VVARVLAQRGGHPGLVHIISAMEGCTSYRPRHDAETGRDLLRPATGKCLHYYFYFIDPAFGLIHLRVPTWCPFRLQFYCNGHGWLAHQLAAEGIGYTMADNAFTRIDDWERAQDLADSFSPERLHRVLDRYAAQCCPVIETFAQGYHRSLMEVEYATDLVFRSAATLGPLYEELIRQSVLSVKAEQVASFLGQRITPQLDQAVDTRFATRIQGTCVKHRFGKASLKMYDKAGIVLRIETTANDVSFFQHHRWVEHRHGPPSQGLAPVKKTIYSLGCLREILLGCNRRYLAHLSALDDVSAGVRALDRLTRPRRVDGKPVKGVNFFEPVDKALLHALQNPRVNIAGVRRGDLAAALERVSPSRLSRQLRRLRDLGLIKRVAGTYRYYLTKMGRAAIAAAERLTQAVIIPAMI
jgi:DNA-binding transcriptional ArsR family regulator